MTHLLENGQPYSPVKTVLAIAVLFTCQAGAVIALAKFLTNRERVENERSKEIARR